VFLLSMLCDSGIFLSWSPGSSNYVPPKIRSVVKECMGQGWQTFGTLIDCLGTRHSLLSHFFLNFFCPSSVPILKDICVCVCVCVYTHQTANKLHMIYHGYQIILREDVFTQIGSGANCWQDIYHWGAGLAGRKMF